VSVLKSENDSSHHVSSGAGIRGSFPSGPITWTSIKRAFPFGNTLSYFTAPGSTILAALINSITYKGTSRGAFLQVWGMRFAMYAFESCLL
jgi:2',3'-cyclic-nucleotide 2'-phosphodiesterase (5'-nucleotidase family)